MFYKWRSRKPTRVGKIKKYKQMTTEQILSEHPYLVADQIIKFEAPTAEKTVEEISGLVSCPSIRWVRDEGIWAVFVATGFCTVQVDSVRNGAWAGSVYIALNPNQELKIRQNRDNLNYDGFSC